MTSPTSPHTTPSGPGYRIRLLDARLPAVDAGRYLITATQHVESLDTGDYLHPVEQRFDVRAPQFALAPERVHAVGPAPGSRADHSSTLAHLTLADPLLPWLRAPAAPGGFRAGRPDDEAPWLALLVLAAGELPDDPRADALTTGRTAGELLADENGVRHPLIDPGQIEGDATAPCRTVDIPGDVFQRLVPRTDELRQLVHVRRVETDTGLRGERLAEGSYAVVLSARLPDPAAETRYCAHLVALEGCAGILADADAGTLTGDVRIRLAALHSWSFTSVPAPGGGFPGRVRHFLFDERDQPRDLALRLPVPAPAPGPEAAVPRPDPDTTGAPAPGPDSATRATALTRLRSGRLPLAHEVETGEETFAWYRGPLTAEPARPLPAAPDTGWRGADQLLVYEPAWGVYDASRAAAWSTGRALALADADFTAVLTAWHTRARAHTARLAQRLATAPAPARAAAPGGVPGPRPLGALLEGYAADGSAARLLDAATRTGPAAARPAPAARRRARDRDRTGRLTALLADPPPALRAAVADRLAPEAAAAGAWLARLKLLHGVPFPCLVPDERMLPEESLRTFYVDPGWLDALAAGAAGVAVTGESDAALARALAPWAGDTDPVPRAGVLIRSALVHECPGLLVRPWRGHGEDRHPLAVLRQEALAADVLLVLFDEVPDEVELAEPPEGLSFGVDTGPSGERVITLRRTDAPAGRELDGQAFPAGGDLTPWLRADPAGRPAVLDLRPAEDSGLLAGLRERLTGLGQTAAAELGPAGLALQLVNAPRRQLLTRAAAGDRHTPTEGRTAP
ncbi:hypothetical protein NX801_03340 [Streptomyces sp. LP05-1]|uniref:Uncharacterized protein n=1 Tax=Streptomyces pyxinae TaxID=2970734 RepID=A0ABT2CBC3_9ACTN|nr:hypothetical protein [Streptomyces sp. LP05-1]MCS0634708.1 hypothetical protein [Streptomyces sp. LP05-1]